MPLFFTIFFGNMMLIDTHSHLYLSQFDADRDETLLKAVNLGIHKILLPNVDCSTIEPMEELVKKYPETCFAMMGLHPTSVKENYEDELNVITDLLSTRKYSAVGEIGIDLYWDKSYLEQQKTAFKYQLDLAKEHDLPVVIHIRESFEETFSVLNSCTGNSFAGVFHCFSGNLVQAKRAIDLGFKLGIGGVVTFKNSGLVDVVKNIDLSEIVLETDSPYLAPTPHRGQRNDPEYLMLIASKIAEIKDMSLEKVAEITTKNAVDLFRLK